MERHWKLIRLLLEYVEINGDGSPLRTPEYDDYSTVQVAYHINLCDEAGYLHVDEGTGRVLNLTWEGHERLESLKGRYTG